MAPQFYLGAMSGTSLDGLDIVLCDFESHQILKHSSFFPFPDSLKDALFSLCHCEQTSLNQLYTTEQTFSLFCSEAIKNFLHQHQIKADSVMAAGIHGQTIRHEPNLPNPFTVQLGDWSRMAADTGLTIIGDFRRKDLALNGQGAPLVPPFHQAMFESNTPRVIANIGGISNISVLKSNEPTLGYDTGPGNALLDFWFSKHHSTHYDHNGDWARSGKIDTNLLNQLRSEPYFLQAFPKSTGRELFNPEWLTPILTEHNTVPAQDIQATLTELTASTLADAVKLHLNKGELFICGGGWRNAFLVERIKELLGKDYSVESTEALGIHSDWIEACAFAWLASNTINKKDSGQASATGADRNAILGGIYYP